MRIHSIGIVALSSALLLAAPVVAAAPQSADQQQVKLAKGTWWGKVGDKVELEFKDGLSVRKMSGTITKIEKGVLTVEGTIDGKKVTRPIFAAEIQSMKTLDGAAAPAGTAPAGTPATTPANTPSTAPATAPAGTPAGTQPATAPSSSDGRKVKAPEPGSTRNIDKGDKVLGVGAAAPSGKKDAQGYDLDVNGYRISPKKGVFMLPWKDTVGETARAKEIEMVAAEADKWGPGQIIVMEIESPGGLVSEIYKISDVLREVRKRHRVVAWIKEAISAAAVTAMHCDEIYFQRAGSLGAATMIRGRDTVSDDLLLPFMSEIGQVVQNNGRPPMVFYAMVKAKAILTYTKDPKTGKPEFHDHITGEPGEVVLSDEKDNLVFNASNALDSGFSQGVADTKEELAKCLGLPEWYEVSDYGVRIGNAWHKLFKDCDEDVQKQMARFDMTRAGGTKEQLGVQIQIGEKLLSWYKRCPPCLELKGIDSERIEKILKELRRRLADIKKAEQQNRTTS